MGDELRKWGTSLLLARDLSHNLCGLCDTRTETTPLRWHSPGDSLGGNRVAQEETVTWTTPSLVEICIGLEINGYLPAEF